METRVLPVINPNNFVPGSGPTSPYLSVGIAVKTIWNGLAGGGALLLRFIVGVLSVVLSCLHLNSEPLWWENGLPREWHHLLVTSPALSLSPGFRKHICLFPRLQTYPVAKLIRLE